ncbi:anti-sigma-K factor RskA [Deinococcus sp. HSC-46F16]|uniref:anti-sigma factor n=1 Tax=Deinococcus sp. HSC-46F16 TaxID=2910968 RepID=UPI00209F609F|nr:anti-sigma factor [Deinococcus sp. HSC-46F16]MCP2013975.1 anti-sigma-K factor RskA [Deinococcus sp. HSC-46F16]
MTPDRDDLLAYALGTLSPAEAARVEAELARDPALRAELRADLDALALLLDDLDPAAVPLPAGAEDALLARVRAEGGPVPHVAPAPLPPARPPRRWPIAVGLVAALALVFALLPRPQPDPLEAYLETPGAVERSLEADGERVGTLVRLPEGRVYVHLSRPLPPERTYQLWRIENGTPVSLGTFERGLLVTLAPGSTLAVSVEPPGGSPQPTTPPLFVQPL